MTSAALLPPYLYGLPRKYQSYRPAQDTAIIAGVTSRAKYVMQAAPVGFGKSINAIMQAYLTGRRTVVLTATKGLQDQYAREFVDIGMVDIRGRANYPCPLDETRYTCEDGPCMGGRRCSLRGKGQCPYANQVQAARKARLVVTNYAYWMNVNRFGDGLGDFDLIVCDEAHDAPSQVEDQMALTITDAEIAGFTRLTPPSHPVDDFFIGPDWAMWASAAAWVLQEECEQLEKAMRGGDATMATFKRLRRRGELRDKLRALSYAGPQCLWVWDRVINDAHPRWTFNPLYAAQWAGGLLQFGAVKQVLLTSGTITPKTAHLLGINPAELDYQDYPSPFDPARGPIYKVPGVRMDHRAAREEQRYVVTIADNIIRRRLDRKGIIHTVSYQRQRDVMTHSAYAGNMMGNFKTVRAGGLGAGGNTSNVVERFKSAPPGMVLVSPTITTGYDFPGKECEYQIVVKLPFPDASSRIMKARARVDPEYHAQLCAVELQQACGRGLRRLDVPDQCETFILDDHAKWFVWKNRHLFNKSFFAFYRTVDVLPEPPPPLPY